MARLRLHFDGWLALPASIRTELALRNGSELEAELVDGSVVLRPAGTASTTTVKAEEAASTAAAASPGPSILATGREPEAAGDEPAPAPVPASLALPPSAKRRGRPPKARSTPSLPVSV